MKAWIAVCLLGAVALPTEAELVQNGGFESLANWDCWNIQCSTTNDHHSGQHAVQVTGRDQDWQGPSQYIDVQEGQTYSASAWVKLLNDNNDQRVEMELDFEFTDNTHDYVPAASHTNARSSEGWVHLQGSFTAPTKALRRTRVYIQSGPSPSVNFLVDDVSVTATGGGGQTGSSNTDPSIDRLRKSDINIRVTTANGINDDNVQIHVVQTKKSFPFGTAVAAGRYNSNAANGRYRDFIHQHFNWAVPENALKWYSLEPNRGDWNCQTAVDMINGLRSHGIKVRGHCLLWSVDQFVQGWIKQVPVNQLRDLVTDHIDRTMDCTRGLLEHWDVNNENLHGQWFQTRLNDPDYNLEMFRIAHNHDSNIKLFLNDYNVVAGGWSTNDYLTQARHFKSANVGLYGLGVQCHFGNEEEPNAGTIKARLDTLAQAGLPIWVTELDVQAQDENRRADFYEKALTALYSHPAVEGILFWGFWDQAHWRGESAALVTGNNLDVTAAGRRVIDLFENQWMTDETHQLSQSGHQFTVRGFHGDYEMRVLYNGQELNNLRQTFTLGSGDRTVNINVHT